MTDVTKVDMSFDKLVDTPWFTTVEPYSREVLRECIEKNLMVHYAPKYEGETYEYSHALFTMGKIKKTQWYLI